MAGTDQLMEHFKLFQYIHLNWATKISTELISFQLFFEDKNQL